jgi:two-component system, chemotaxis family, sensor kinase CheA
MDRVALGQLYRSESRDYLDSLGRSLLTLERGEGRQAIDEAFRLVHTLKGMSAAMGYDSVVTLAHGVEHLLERLRSGLLKVDAEMMDLLYQAVDQLERVIEEAWRADEETGFGGATGRMTSPRRGPRDGADKSEVAAATRFVRVEQERIDRLVDRAGELMVSRERLLGAAAVDKSDGFREVAEELGRGIADLREEVFRLRLAPIADVFDRMHRLMRDTSKNLGKEVRLEVQGEDVELDRALIGDLADLLTHLLRNAVDHGIESPEERTSAGKDSAGTVWVSASADMETITVRVQDDGRGIDFDAITKRAAADGLRTTADVAELGPEELFDLLTRPGFSTAREVTEVSGRGVGLDRVASRLRELGGNMEITSEAGAGAAFTLRLPKTLSLTRVLLVASGSQTLAIPSSAIDRVEDYGKPATSGRMGEEEPRGTVQDLAKLLGLRGRDGVVTDGFVVVLFGTGRRQDLLVDRLIGMRDVVVKRFVAPRQVLDLYAGASILPDGMPCLVLQPGRLLSLLPAAGGADLAPSPTGTTGQ